MPLVRYSQPRFLSIILLAWLGVFFLTRSALLATHLAEAEVVFPNLLRIFGVGLIYDLGFLLYATLPLSLYLLLCPKGLWQRKWHQRALRAFLGLMLFVMLFTAAAEWLFWDEFGVRFNFIAVDYLVYSKEVINNILESYRIYPILAGLAIAATGIAVALKKPLDAAFAAPALPRTLAWPANAGVLLVVGVSAALLGQNFPRGLGGNAYQSELASNGPFQFFAAFRNNELDYRQFFATLPDNRVAELLRSEVAEPNARFIGSDPEDIRRVIDNPGQAQRMNVVLVTIESLSAKYLGSFGDTRGLTPNLDELLKHGLFFSNFYATGTRTDRGLEAITLSVPPTPAARSSRESAGKPVMPVSASSSMQWATTACSFMAGAVTSTT